ncbi:ATP-binding protein [Rhizobium sp. 32-5/1]|uniref:ATP-binding protein n=1 Tax=Rhizobium sp. 32-5/1 TaxID=3019602 RepID=UPI00240D6B53|nr:ATP-binding protein [Rhizobium sp. 32-5/1]WEZ84932.1 ATP-binding protein [Rhizobium sp. 32-5/1]
MTVSARHSGDIIRKASKATVVLQAFAVLLLLGLIFLFTDISRKYSALQDGIRENALWSVYQLDREARRLHETLHIMLVEDDLSPDRVKTLGMRYDILYSRMNILEKTTFERKFKLDDTIAGQIADIRLKVFGRVSTFDKLAAGGNIDRSEFETTDRDFEQLVVNTEKLLIYTNNTVSIERAEARDAVLSLQVKSAYLVALLVCCVVFLILTLRRQLKSVRLAGLSLEAISNKLNEAYLGAEAGNRAKSQFMATMGHEIRTPLNAILGTAELLELSSLPPSVAPGVQTIRRSGQALLEIINEILDFAKIEHGKLDVETRTVDVRAVVNTTVEILRDRATEHGNRMALDMPAIFSAPVISSDPTRLRQVLLNLLSNAIKFTKEGTVTLRIREIGGGDSAGLRFEIVDTGIGIDDDGLCKLFRPFSQVDASISRKYGGTGLGLTISKQIVEALDGTIGVESRKGEGSTFWFEIPAKPAENVLVKALDTNTASTPPLPSMNILLVEDNLVNQQVAAGFLGHLGQRVTIANDGLEAVEMAETGSFDLVLMDMQMPRLDGIEATKRIRASSSACRTVPIIAMTANASDDDRRLCGEAGMTGFQSKPVTMQQLQGIIRSLKTDEPPSEKSGCGPIEVSNSFEARRAEIVEALGEDTFDELLSSFFDDAANLLRDLHSALAVNDYRNTDSLLHTLKGAASSIGFEDVADRSQKLRHASITETALAELQDTVTHHRQRLVA